MKSPDLHGKRINLIKINKNILSDLHEYSTNPLVYQYLEFPAFTDINKTEDYLNKLIKRSEGENAQYWSIYSIKEKKVIGTIGVLNIDWRRMNGEIGYGLSANYWGNGYANEAIKILLKFLFHNRNFHKVSATTRSDHVKSINALTKIGMTNEGILRDYYLSHDGKRFDASVFSILGYEYQY
jgi:[ribosomal protein S5]-alanine N-acetyltransferase